MRLSDRQEIEKELDLIPYETSNLGTIKVGKIVIAPREPRGVEEKTAPSNNTAAQPSEAANNVGVL